MEQSTDKKKFSALKASSIQNVKRLSTGCSSIDELLRGGLPSKGIIEIAGESGSGKSQLCMQISLTVQYPISDGGLEGGVAYIYTEGSFPSKRLHELISEFPKQYFRNQSYQINFGSNIFLEHVFDFENLQECLSKRIPVLVNTKDIKLVIIDSITAIFRGSYAQSELYQKTKDLRCIGNILHYLCANFGVMTLCVNQVSQVVTSTDSTKTTETIPAMGLAWANMVTTRIQLQSELVAIKKFQVVFSPELPPECTHYKITKCGITGS